VILGYVEQPSPRAGGLMVLRVATDAPWFRVVPVRCGAATAAGEAGDWLPGAPAPPHLPFHDWGVPNEDLRGRPLPPWPAYLVPAPPDPGVHVLLLVEGDARRREVRRPRAPDGRDARALVVVRPPRGAPPAPVLFKLPLHTYHAYNLALPEEYDPATAEGHWCLYSTPRPDEVPRPVPAAVGLHRPGGGTGGCPYDRDRNPDPFDPTPRQTFAHWDARMLAWLEREGHDVDVCTDVDLHREGRALLDGHRLLLSCGHDEYWTEAMRDAVEGWVADGGNAAFLGGNTAWWRVAYEDDRAFRRTGFWHAEGRPENTLTGVSFRNGGERDRDEHPDPVGFRVQHAGHWVFAGTGLRDGDVVGGARDQYLVGYECDGALFDRADLAAGRPVTPDGGDGTPPHFTILGVGDCRPWGFGNGAATMGVMEPGGTVVTGATTDWPRVLTDGRCPPLERITRNVVERLSR
jgi:hypothetical protein